MLTQSDLNEVRSVVQEEVKIQLTDFRSEMISHLDAILKITTDTQQDLTILNHKIIEHTDQIENHEERLETIESNLQPTQVN